MKELAREKDKSKIVEKCWTRSIHDAKKKFGKTDSPLRSSLSEENYTIMDMSTDTEEVIDPNFDTTEMPQPSVSDEDIFVDLTLLSTDLVVPPNLINIKANSIANQPPVTL